MIKLIEKLYVIKKVGRKERLMGLKSYASIIGVDPVKYKTYVFTINYYLSFHLFCLSCYKLLKLKEEFFYYYSSFFCKLFGCGKI